MGLGARLATLVGALRSDNPMVRAIVGTLPLALILLAVVELVVIYGGPADQRTLLTFLINLVAVMGLAIFVGNTGFLSFGHVGFMALGAYCGGLLVLPAGIKATALPDLPGFLAGAELGFVPALLIAMAFVALVGFVVGIPLSRLDGAGLAIASIGLLIIINVVLNGATSITRGANTLYGLPSLVTPQGALAIAILAILLARVFKESRIGLRLRASREDEVASRAMGVPVERYRLIAWVVSLAVTGAAGFMLGLSLGAFSPHEFYFDLTFLLLAMLIVGGMTSVTGAVAGTALVTIVNEILRQASSGFSVGPISFGEIFGLTQLGFGVVILITMYKRQSGLFGYQELSDLISRYRLKGDERV